MGKGGIETIKCQTSLQPRPAKYGTHKRNITTVNTAAGSIINTTEMEAETYVPERSACGQGAAWAPERSRITTRETTRERLTDL